MIEKLLAGLRDSDPETATAALAEDVTLHVAVHDQAFEGKATAAAILSTVLDGVFSRVEVTETIESPTRTVVMFDLDVINYPHRAQGLLTLRLNPAGQVAEIIVFLRPLAALQEVSAEMGRRLGGPPPQGAH